MKILKIRITNDTNYIIFKEKLIKQLNEIEEFNFKATIIDCRIKNIKQIIKYIELIKLYLSGFNEKDEMKFLYFQIHDYEVENNELFDILKNYQIPIIYCKKPEDDIEKVTYFTLKRIKESIKVCLIMENEKENEEIFKPFKNKKNGKEKIFKKVFKYLLTLITYKEKNSDKKSSALSIFNSKEKIELYDINLKKIGELCD